MGNIELTILFAALGAFAFGVTVGSQVVMYLTFDADCRILEMLHQRDETIQRLIEERDRAATADPADWWKGE